jgi:hypothetical protein
VYPVEVFRLKSRCTSAGRLEALTNYVTAESPIIHDVCH